ncbi:MAG TPA: CDP-alcohol phosphatidyltransferase family protein [Burkholderiales bacterium]|nr:CDP-alcohol phosphatidyltransferase family protein [Burkholderiales bacterium]
MLDATIRRIVTSPLDPLADGLARAGVPANALTIGGFAIGLVAAALIADEAFLLGVIFLALNRVADILDGMVARRTGMTPLGAFLDASLDLFVYAAIPFAFALAHQQDALAATFLLMGLMVAAVPAITMRARDGENQRARALCGHSETFVAFVLMCAAPRWMFSLLAYFYGALCFVSAGVTIASAITQYRAAQEP